jgi:hypothetical protein
MTSEPNGYSGWSFWLRDHIIFHPNWDTFESVGENWVIIVGQKKDIEISSQQGHRSPGFWSPCSLQSTSLCWLQPVSTVLPWRALGPFLSHPMALTSPYLHPHIQWKATFRAQPPWYKFKAIRFPFGQPSWELTLPSF